MGMILRRESGDCITVALDLDKQSISWYKNEDETPVATLSNVPRASYKVAAHGYEDDSFTIM